MTADRPNTAVEGDLAELRHLSDASKRLKNEWSCSQDNELWASCCAADRAFEDAAVNYVRTHVLADPALPAPTEARKALEALAEIDAHEEADTYEWRGDSDHTPTDNEKALLEDFGVGLIAKFESILRSLARPASDPAPAGSGFVAMAEGWASLDPMEVVRRTRCEADKDTGQALGWRSACDVILDRLATPSPPQADVRADAGERGDKLKPPFRTGDHVYHEPTGETWVVAYADPETGRISWLGWPPDGEASSEHCRLTEAASDERHRVCLGALKRSGGRRWQTAMRLYGDVDLPPTLDRAAAPAGDGGAR